MKIHTSLEVGDEAYTKQVKHRGHQRRAMHDYSDDISKHKVEDMTGFKTK